MFKGHTLKRIMEGLFTGSFHRWGKTDIVLEAETAKHLDKIEDWEMGFSWHRNDYSVPASGLK